MVDDPRADELMALLNRELALLISGKLGELGGIATEKERLVRGLATGSGQSARLQELLRQSHRNAALLEAAAKGIDSARRRLKALREATGPIRSYGPAGERQRIGTSHPNFSRKA